MHSPHTNNSSNSDGLDDNQNDTMMMHEYSRGFDGGYGDGAGVDFGAGTDFGAGASVGAGGAVSWPPHGLPDFLGAAMQAATTTPLFPHYPAAELRVPGAAAAAPPMSNNMNTTNPNTTSITTPCEAAFSNGPEGYTDSHHHPHYHHYHASMGNNGGGEMVGGEFNEFVSVPSLERLDEPYHSYVKCTITPHECVNVFEQWKEGLWLAPRDFAQNATGLAEKLELIYAPFYVFSLTVGSTFQASLLMADRGRTRHNASSLPTPPNFSPIPPLPPLHAFSDAGASRHHHDDHQSSAYRPSAAAAASSSVITANTSRGIWEPAGLMLGEPCNVHRAWVSNPVGTTVRISLDEQQEQRKAAGTGWGFNAQTLLTAPQRVAQTVVDAVNKKGKRREASAQAAAAALNTRTVDIIGNHNNKYNNLVMSCSHSITSPLLAALQDELYQDCDKLVPLNVQEGPLGASDNGVGVGGGARPNDAYHTHVFRTIFPNVEPIPWSPQAAEEARAARKREAENEAGLPRSTSEGDDWVVSGAPRRATVTVWLDTVKQVDIPAQQIWASKVWPKVKEAEAAFTKQLITQHKHYRHLQSCDIDLTLTSLDYKCVLIPFYVSRYQYEGQEYSVLIHGRTGRISAQRPWIGQHYVDAAQNYIRPQ